MKIANDTKTAIWNGQVVSITKNLVSFVADNRVQFVDVLFQFGGKFYSGKCHRQQNGIHSSRWGSWIVRDETVKEIA